MKYFQKIKNVFDFFNNKKHHSLIMAKFTAKNYD